MPDGTRNLVDRHALEVTISVIEATRSGVSVTDGGDARLTTPLLDQLTRLDHGPLGTRWFLDGEMLLGQIWWVVDSTGECLSGPTEDDISSLFGELDRLVATTLHNEALRS